MLVVFIERLGVPLASMWATAQCHSDMGWTQTVVSIFRWKKYQNLIPQCVMIETLLLEATVVPNEYQDNGQGGDNIKGLHLDGFHQQSMSRSPRT